MAPPIVRPSEDVDTFAFGIGRTVLDSCDGPGPSAREPCLRCSAEVRTDCLRCALACGHCSGERPCEGRRRDRRGRGRRLDDDRRRRLDSSGARLGDVGVQGRRRRRSHQRRQGVVRRISENRTR